MKKNKRLLTILSFVLSIVIGTGFVNPSVYADEIEPEQMKPFVEARFEDEVIQIKVENEDIEVVSIVEEESNIEAIQNDYLYEYAVGKNGHYKFKLTYTEKQLIEEGNVETELEYKTYLFDVLVDSFDEGLATSDLVAEEEIESIVSVSEDIQEIESVEISPFADTPDGVLNIDHSVGWWLDGSSYGADGLMSISGDWTVCGERTKTYTSGTPYYKFSENDMSSIGLSNAQVAKLSIMGYYAKKRAEETGNVDWWAVFQNAVWFEQGDLNGWMASPTFPTYSSIMAGIQVLEADVVIYNTRPSFHAGSYKVTGNGTLEITDTNNVLSSYKILDANGMDASISGNKLIVKGANANSVKDITLARDIDAADIGANILFSAGDNVQKIGSFKIFDPLRSYVEIQNESLGKLELGKSDSEAVMYPGVVFELSRDKNTISDTVTTGANGRVIVENLTEGKIYYREKSVVSPLIIDTAWKEITIEAGKTASTTVVNKRAQWTFSILKQDEHGKPLVVTFDMYDENNVHLGTITTGADGKYTSGKLELGSITLIEKSAPNGIVLDKTPIKLTGTYKDQHTEVVLVSKTITNNYRDFNVTLSKVEDTSDIFNPELHGQALEGVELEYYARTDIYEGTTLRYLAGELVGKLVTNAAGQVKFHNLPEGGYRIKETATKEGYQLFNGHWDMDVKYTGNDATVSVVEVGKTITNSPIYGSVELVKANATATVRLPGAEFDLYRNDKKIGTYTSDKDGRIVVDGLRHSTGGAYRFEEIKSPYGYWLSEEPIYFDITEQGETVYLIAPNVLIEAHLEWNKIDEDGKPVEGVGFKIRNTQTGEFVTLVHADGRDIIEENIWYTDTNGDVFVKGLISAGEYELVEVVTPPHLKPNAPIPFTVDENQDYIDLGTLVGLSLDLGEIINAWKLGYIRIQKLDEETGQPLSYFGFNLYDVDGNFIQYVETGLDGTVKLPARYGVYDIAEVKVNGEYVYNDSNRRQTIFVEEDGETYTVTFQNKKAKGRLEGLKVDYKDGTPVGGATYGKFDLDGNLLETTVTAPDGAFVFDDIELGTYIFKETETVEDYRLDETEYEVTFTYENATTPIIKRELKVEEMRNARIETNASFHDRDKENPNIVTLVDVVSYEDLKIGLEHTANATLMDPVTKEPILINGEQVTGTTTFTPTENDGSVEVSITFDVSTLETDKVVFFQDLLEEDELVAVHHDINDANQTVEIPKIKTSASFTDRDKKEPNIVSITDVVSYSGLVPGKEYNVSGYLMDKETEEPIIIDGKKIESSVTFTPTESSGTVDVIFTFDINKLKTKTVVVFEDVYEEERLIATHHDINDIDQTLEVITVQFNKKDSVTKERLKDAEFTMFDLEGNVLDKKWTDENGIAEFKIMEGETVDFKETNAPQGFILSDEVIRVTGSKGIDGNLYTIEFFNDLMPEIKLPPTGVDPSNFLPMMFLLLGALFILVSGTMYKFRKLELSKFGIFILEPQDEEIHEETENEREASTKNILVLGKTGKGSVRHGIEDERTSTINDRKRE